MQVPDDMRKDVAFLYCWRKGERRPAGTAFFGRWPVPNYPDQPLGVVLTAQHVIAAIRRKADDDRVLMRLNTRAGDAIWAESLVDDWDHPDTGVDCAALHWHPGELDVDHRAWDLTPEVVATDDVIRQEAIGIGDEVFMVGLFRNHLGLDRNEPIIRVGNIAAMPADPIRSKYGDMRAILVEARSIGGLSGSPVFVHMGYTRWREGEVKFATADKPFLLLGLMHGHWEALETEADTSADVAEGRINTGIGIVVPAHEILRVLRPRMDAVAQARRLELDRENQPKMDD